VLAARDAAAAIKPSAADVAAHSGAKIAQTIHELRIRAITALREKLGRHQH
jgi:hypothetical protein